MSFLLCMVKRLIGFLFCPKTKKGTPALSNAFKKLGRNFALLTRVEFNQIKIETTSINRKVTFYCWKISLISCTSLPQQHKLLLICIVDCTKKIKYFNGFYHVLVLNLCSSNMFLLNLVLAHPVNKVFFKVCTTV